MTGCAFQGCSDPACPVCRWLRVPQKPPRCQKSVEGLQCRFIDQHSGPCKPPYNRKTRPHQPVDGALPF